MACGGMLHSTKSSGSLRMVNNEKLAKEVNEKKKLMEENTMLLDEAIEEMKDKLKEMKDVAQAEKDEDFSRGKEKVSLEDEIPEPYSPLGEQ